VTDAFPLRVIGLAMAVLSWSAPADAQIYAVRDDRGVLILSDRPLGPNAATYEVGTTGAVRAARPAEPTRAGRFEHLIEHHADLQQVRPDLVRAVIQVESAFNPYARSHKGAMGLMQLMPGTAAQYQVTNAYDPTENIRAGVAYLRALLDRYQGNEELALAAYNAGPGAVDRYGQRVPPFRETRDYVQKIRMRTGTLSDQAHAQERAIYKVVELVDGVAVPRYTDRKPSGSGYEIVARAPARPTPPAEP
jgi:soluble lytic murein transglycosylase-like protein